MKAALDRTRLAALTSDEERLFTERHPRSRRALRAGRRPPPRRRAHELDDALGGPLPALRREAHGAHFTDVDGHEYVDFCLGDTGAMTGHSPDGDGRGGRARRPTAASPRCCPPRTSLWVADELRRRFGLPYWQFALTATDANRFAAAPRAARHRAAEGAGLQLLLPRLGRRDLRHARADGVASGRGRATSGPPVDPTRDHQGRRVQRPRGARAGARATATWPACSPSRR